MALLMATAWHNIEGASRLSDQDGAGGIHGWALVNAAREGRATFTTLTSSSFTTNGYYTFNIFLQGGDKARVAIAWSSNADSGYTTDVLDADLDLAVFQGAGQTSGTSLGFSSSFNNNFEIVEFVPPVTGIYTVRINDFRFDGTSERCGIAWTQKTLDTSTSRLMERNVSGENPLRTGPVIDNRYWLDINTPHSPNTMWICIPGTPGLGGSPLGSETWSPLTVDLWTNLWFENLVTPVWPWKSYDGTTNSNGYGFVNRLDRIFNFAFLVGYDITHVGLMIDPSYPDGIREITEPLTMEFWPEATAVTTLGLDGNTSIALPFSFPFYGVNYNSVFLNANGYLTLGAPDTDWTESQAEMLADQPRIALFWDDLDSRTEGTVAVREILYWGERSVVFDFVEVPQFSTAGDANTGRITLYDDGRIRLQWREDCGIEDCLVGISPGGGISANDPIDLSSHGFATQFGAIYEVFSPATNPFDLPHPGILNFSGMWHNEIEFIPSGSGYRLEMNVDR
jgi:hypothetical protein